MKEKDGKEKRRDTKWRENKDEFKAIYAPDNLFYTGNELIVKKQSS